MTVYEIATLPKLFDSYKHASFFTIDELKRFISGIVGRDNIKVTTSKFTDKNTAKIFVSMEGGLKMQFGTFLKLENEF